MRSVADLTTTSTQGVHAKVISERLGHSNIKTTLDILTCIAKYAGSAANKIDALLAKYRCGTKLAPTTIFYKTICNP